MSKSKISAKYVFKTFVWPRRSIIGFGLFLIVISRLAGLILPGASKYLMDDVIVNKDYDMLKTLLFAVSGAITVQATSSFFLTRILSVEAQRLISILRAQVQKKILQLPIRFFWALFSVP